MHVEPAGRSGDRRRERDGAQLHREGIDAERARRLLVLAHGDQVGAEARALQPARGEQRQADDGDDKEDEEAPIGELQGREARPQGQEQPGRTPGEVGGIGQDAEHLREGKRHEGEVGAAQARPEAQIADGEAGERPEADARPERGPGVPAELHLEDRGGVGTGAEEGGVAEGILPAEAAEHVPAQSRERDDERGDEEVEQAARQPEEGQGGEHHEDEEDGQEVAGAHARAPNRPVGRTSSTRMKIRKMPI